MSLSRCEYIVNKIAESKSRCWQAGQQIDRIYISKDDLDIVEQYGNYIEYFPKEKDRPSKLLGLKVYPVLTDNHLFMC